MCWHVSDAHQTQTAAGGKKLPVASCQLQLSMHPAAGWGTRCHSVACATACQGNGMTIRDASTGQRRDNDQSQSNRSEAVQFLACLI